MMDIMKLPADDRMSLKNLLYISMKRRRFEQERIKHPEQWFQEQAVRNLNLEKYVPHLDVV